jgi:exopolyphosphatase / guanosine-5'-triphosphate,3'-diphosphate pyrophosphatase
MIAAIIDCGTNTFNLLIAEFDIMGKHSILLNTKKSVKLGEEGLVNNKIAPQAFQRGVTTFNEFVEVARNYNADTIKAFATSAVRSTINGPEFVKKVYEKTGVMIQVINGDTEAQYIFKGVNLSFERLNQPVLIMDIGGGSTEFIIAEDEQVIWKKSFDLGATRLLQEFKPSDPIQPEEIERIKEYFKDVLQPLSTRLKKNPVTTLIGCSGSFESLSDMIQTQKLERHDHEKLYKFNPDELKAIHRKLLDSSEEQRRQMPGLVEYRIDTIVCASILIRHVIKRFKLENIYYSPYALKEGILADLISNRISI